MNTDLENRLRRYGNTLDNATSRPHAVVEAHTDHPFNPHDVEVELGYLAGRPRNRSRSLVGAACLIAAASAAFVFVINQRHTDPQVPASGPEAATGQWPLRLAPGLTPWFEANDPITADFGRPEPGPAQQRLRCTTWTTDSQTITCDSLTGEGYLPAVTYPGPNNNYVDISTLHSNIDAATYATNYSQGKDVGYEDTPLPQQDVTINGSSGRLIETANGIRRVTWSPQPGALVAVETGPGLTRDDLLTIASNITATPTLPSIPLVLASTEIDTSSRQAVALGGVINGEICLTTTTGCTQVLQSTSEPGTVAAAAIYAQPTDFGIAGIVTGDIITIRATHPDGSITDLHPTQQPIGTTQAFALITDTAVTLSGLDAAGNPIRNIEVTNVPRPAEGVTPTTVTVSTTPGTIAPPPDCRATNIAEMPVLTGLSVEDATRLLAAFCVQPVITFADPGSAESNTQPYPSGIISAQEPAAGTQISFGAAVTLTARSTLPDISVPSTPGTSAAGG